MYEWSSHHLHSSAILMQQIMCSVFIRREGTMHFHFISTHTTSEFHIFITQKKSFMFYLTNVIRFLNLMFV